ncbi:hypothetical protein SO694_00078189 [Aureococcus anophagefferens]|uniref:Uncharacterized protein n=1 Tax=Aureococcus anophagefferens TaxID=44056 RepID=A0ABR1FH56_AURAN
MATYKPTSLDGRALTAALPRTAAAIDPSAIAAFTVQGTLDRLRDTPGARAPGRARVGDGARREAPLEDLSEDELLQASLLNYVAELWDAPSAGDFNVITAVLALGALEHRLVDERFDADDTADWAAGRVEALERARATSARVKTLAVGVGRLASAGAAAYAAGGDGGTASAVAVARAGQAWTAAYSGGARRRAPSSAGSSRGRWAPRRARRSPAGRRRRAGGPARGGAGGGGALGAAARRAEETDRWSDVDSDDDPVDEAASLAEVARAKAARAEVLRARAARLAAEAEAAEAQAEAEAAAAAASEEAASEEAAVSPADADASTAPAPAAAPEVPPEPQLPAEVSVQN